MKTVRKSNCHQCGYLCGVEVEVGKEGEIISIAPDPERYPYDAALVKQCQRFSVLKEHLYHPERMNYPLKRAGKRGEGRWQRISWDQALDEITSELQSLRADFGPETLATCISAPHAIYWPLHRFLNLWGSPNNIGIGISCWNPRIWVHSLTFGWPTEDELDPEETRCALLWGVNPAESDHSLFWKNVKAFSKKGRYLIVIDPRRTRTAALADLWLRITPGTDGALALGILHVVIEEKLYDQAFVEKWCSGFDALCRRVKTFSLSKVSDITGISVTDIEKTARVYAASSPASVWTGLGIDMSGVNSTQTLRTIAILRAITGNLDVPGASLINEKPDFIPEVEMELSRAFPASQREKKLGKRLFPLQRYEGYEKLTRYTLQHEKKLPARYLTSTHPHLAWQSMTTEKPYAIRALVTMASNPLLCQANTPLVYKALKGLTLLVSLEHYLTSTAMLSDYVLPMAGSLEKPMIQTNGGVANIAYGGPSAIAPLFERRTGYDFWSELGRRCGQADYWPWKTLEEALGEMFSPTGLSWDGFCETGLYAPAPNYRKYLKKGFSTPSGKVELFSTLLEEMGHDPLPDYTPVADKDEFYPLRLMTGARKQPYYASEFRQIGPLRKRQPFPVAEMSAETAKKFGITKGDWIWIETPNGRIKQKLESAEMEADIVSVDYGWWYPERENAEPDLGGLWESNANVLTSADTDACDPILGQWNFRSLRCRVYRAEKEPV